MTRLARAVAAVAAAVVACGSAVVSPAVPPVAAVSPTLSFDCAWSGNHQGSVSAVLDTALPATIIAGLKVPTGVTASITLPADVASSLRSTSASYDGTGTVDLVVDGQLRAVSVTIPKTAVPAGSPGSALVVSAAGTTGIGGDAVAGTLAVSTSGFDLQVTGYGSQGTSVTGSTMSCALGGGQAGVVDTVTVVPAPTTTTVDLPVGKVPFGVGVDASAVVTSSNLKRPQGTVTFAFGGRSVTVAVVKSRATASLPASGKLGPQQVTATFTPAAGASTTWAGSAATADLTVVRDGTTTTSSAVRKAARKRIVATAAVSSDHGTAVAGDVRFKLLRNGVIFRSAHLRLDSGDRARFVFKNVTAPGRYVLTARYLGSPTLKGSVSRSTLRIR